MHEQEIEMQIFEELQKLKDIVSKVREAENAYRTSSELLGKAAKQYSDLSSLKDELNAQVQTTRENLPKIFSIFEQSNTKKLDFLNEELIKLRINLPKDVSPQFNEINAQVKKVNQSIDAISTEFTLLKKKQEKNTIYIRIGFFLIVTISLILLASQIQN